MYVNDIFTSIQGEGASVGNPAFFIRFQGCPIHCSFCDTKESWDPKRACMELTTHDIISRIVAEQKNIFPNISHVVLTGGEPFYGSNGRSLPILINGLTNRGFICQIETSGTILPQDFFESLRSPEMLFITISPKARDPDSKQFLVVQSEFFADNADILCEKTSIELKFLVDGTDNSRRRIDHFFSQPSMNRFVGLISVQPVDFGKDNKDQTAKAIKQAVQLVKETGWLLSCQTHKYLGIK